MLDTILMASVMEGSDRARAILYSVVEDNNNDEAIKESYKMIDEIYKIKENYDFDKEQLDLDKVSKRIKAIDNIIKKGMKKTK